MNINFNPRKLTTSVNLPEGRQRLSWPETALRLAYNIADYRSQDPYVQVGAVIIKNDNSIILGYNGPPPEIEIDWSIRDERRKRIIHAEENVLSEIKRGEARIMAVTGLPCEHCIKSIAKKGIKEVFYGKALEGYDHALTFQLAKEFGITLTQITV